MFERFFTFIRQGVKAAVVAGVDDAQAELAARADATEARLVDATAGRIEASPAIEAEPQDEQQAIEDPQARGNGRKATANGRRGRAAAGVR